MRVLALDIGEKRIGVASADTTTRVATPVKVVAACDVHSNSREWKFLLEDYEPELFVVGCPMSLDGRMGKQAQRVKQAAESIATRAGLSVEYVDERLSSSEAKRIMHEQGFSERDMRGKLDAVAASVFLQTWLDKNYAK